MAIVTPLPTSQVFNWLWPSLVQERLDHFRDYWNNHKISKQKEKINPSGTSPRQLWLAPTTARETARNCAININLDTVRQLREEFGGQQTRDEMFQFVTDEFRAYADGALGQLGYPRVTLSSAWDVFVVVVDILGQS
jgi:hypothetical protein